MADRSAEIKTALTDLIKSGARLQLTLLAKAPDDVREQVAELLGAPEDKRTQRKAEKERSMTTSGQPAAKDIKTAMTEDFGGAYQFWYSSALPVVQHVLPDRYSEFRELHRLDKRPRELDPVTYSISDYIQGISVTQGLYEQEVFSGWKVAYTKLESQISILRSAEGRLSSILADITGVIESGLLDDELAAARELSKRGYLRSAGIVAGVVLVVLC